MQSQHIVLIDGRFELLNSPNKVELYDIRNLKKDGQGKVIPVAVIPLDVPVSDREAGKMALNWLRRSEYLTMSEFLEFTDVFLASQSIVSDQVNRKRAIQGNLVSK